MANTEQNFSNHVKLDPPFHFFLMPVFLASLIVSIVHFFRVPDFFSFWMIVFTLAVLLGALKMRSYSLKVQDRVIRLEERLRLSILLPASEQAKAAELPVNQLVALRFASDGELPALASRAIAEKLPPKAIKQAIQVWRPDYWRV